MAFFGFKTPYCVLLACLSFSLSQASPTRGLQCVYQQVYENGTANDFKFCCPNADGGMEFGDVRQHQNCCIGAEDPVYDEREFDCIGAEKLRRVSSKGLQCVYQQVYENGTANDFKFCCPNADGGMEFGDVRQHQNCCIGAKDPVYDEREFDCIGAEKLRRVSSKSEVLLFFKKESIKKIRKGKKNFVDLKGTLVVPDTFHRKEIKIENVKIKQPGHNGFGKLKKASWFALYTSNGVPSTSVVLRLKKKSKLIPLGRPMAKMQDKILEKILTSTQQPQA